jgi:hypothetical protein
MLSAGDPATSLIAMGGNASWRGIYDQTHRVSFLWRNVHLQLPKQRLKSFTARI